ncbi:MAG: glycosyltransferase [Phycisphaerales bacterium]|nr:glycosyltransferase [Phycisphaerales bacterium]
MHILACFDIDRLRQEAPAIKALIEGLREHGCDITAVVPDGLPDELAHIHVDHLGANELLTAPMPMPLWQRRWQGRQLAEHFHRSPPELIWAFGTGAHGQATSAADTLGCPAVLSIWSLHTARRASPRQQQVGAWIAASPTLASILGKRVGNELVECIPPATTITPTTADPVGLAPSIAVLDAGHDPESMRALLTGLAPVVKAVPELHVCLELTGDSEHAAWQLADSEGLLDHISTVADAATVRPLIARCDVVIQPDRTADARTLVLDAMANQRTIACAKAPHLDWLVDGETARFIPEANPDAWSSALLELLHDPRQRQKLGEGARQRIETHHSLETQVQSHLATFHRTCNGVSYPFVSQDKA